MAASPDAIADCVLATFDQLPDKRKPRPRSDGSREWVPLAGIVLAKDGQLTCVSLGTGMKCLPASKLPQAKGNILHDWHAEVLAIRAFNRFLVDECLAAITPPHTPSQYLVARNDHDRNGAQHQLFQLRDEVQIHMYCSEAPCGDASMELVMDAQEDATPWVTPPSVVSLPESPSANESTALRGRSHFGLLGAVRLKPSRPDAPPTLSKSCTDKLALKQCTSLLSSLASLLISPRNAYLSSLVLPSSQYVEAACSRAFGLHGRLAPVATDLHSAWPDGYTFRPFNVRPTVREFKHSRRSAAGPDKLIPSNISAVHTPQSQETLIGGVLQGRKQLDPRGASMVCRSSLWKAVIQVAALAGLPMVLRAVRKETYGDVKGDELLAGREVVKRDVRSVLGNWVRNSGDEGFGEGIGEG